MSHHNPAHAHVDWAERGAEMTRDAEVAAPMVEQIVSWLVGRLPDVRDVLDVGSGPGVAAVMFAERAPRASVVAADGAEPLLRLAAARAAERGAADRFATARVVLPDGLADLSRADIVYASGVVHHLPDPVGALRALGELVKPGGLLAVREGGLPVRFLPGGVAPGLLARLEAIFEDLVDAGDHPAGVVATRGGWPDLMEAAGLTPAGSRTFLLDLPAPLPEAARHYVAHQLEMLRDFAGDHVSGADAAALERLLDPESPEGVLRRDDLFVLAASTVHTAQP